VTCRGKSRREVTCVRGCCPGVGLVGHLGVGHGNREVEGPGDLPACRAIRAVPTTGATSIATDWMPSAVTPLSAVGHACPQLEVDIAATPVRRARPPDAERSAVGVGPLAGRPGTHAGRVAAAADRAEAGGEPAADPGGCRRWPGEERAGRHHQAGHEQGAERGLDEPDEVVEGGRGGAAREHAGRRAAQVQLLVRQSVGLRPRLRHPRAGDDLVHTVVHKPGRPRWRASRTCSAPARVPGQPFLGQVSGRLINQPFSRRGGWRRARDLAGQRVQSPAAEVVGGYPSNSSPVLMFGYSAMLFW
jgi:hypothetical protein